MRTRPRARAPKRSSLADHRNKYDQQSTSCLWRAGVLTFRQSLVATLGSPMVHATVGIRARAIRRPKPATGGWALRAQEGAPVQTEWKSRHEPRARGDFGQRPRRNRRASRERDAAIIAETKGSCSASAGRLRSRTQSKGGVHGDGGEASSRAETKGSCTATAARLWSNRKRNPGYPGTSLSLQTQFLDLAKNRPGLRPRPQGVKWRRFKG